jgi:hypothetical protein
LLRPHTAGSLAALEAGRTLAVHLVSHHGALAGGDAGVLDGAGRDTVAVDAGLVAGTVSV